jgi:simple sugar transport system ATP-binding protein
VVSSTENRNRPSAPILSIRHITKSFPGVIANDDISLDLYSGQVHCLLGENGAGKSTLISILAGMQQPDEGWIEAEGVKTSISSPRSAMDLGIGVVYQHSTLISTMTVLENLMLGDTGHITLDIKGAKARLRELGELLGSPLEGSALAADLALGQQQQVEIAKAMWKGSKVLILDEPTSMLTPQAIADLEASVERLKKKGLAIVFITHKLREAYSMGDEISVLRHGRLVKSIPATELADSTEKQVKDAVLDAMFGEDLEAVGTKSLAQELSASGNAHHLRSPKSFSGTPPALVLDDISSHDSMTETPVRGLSLQIHPGEVVGVAGIDGHGQRHLAELVAGQRKLAAGNVKLGGKVISGLGVRGRQALGIRYVTDDRLHEGIVGDLGVAVNLVLKRIGMPPFWRFGRMNKVAVDLEARSLVDSFDIRTPLLHTRAGTLSGGNIQKLLLARELTHEPRVVIFNKPTYGLDLKTVSRVRAIMREFADGGGSVLLISTDLDELVELSDRIVLISSGRLVGEVRNDSPRTAELVGELMLGPSA